MGRTDVPIMAAKFKKLKAQHSYELKRSIMKVCFINLKGFDLIVQSKNPRYVGGAEMQQVLIGEGMKMAGDEISYITLDYGQDEKVEIDGITIFKCYENNKGAPLIRFFHPRLTGLWRAMNRADADVYHLMGYGYEVGLAALWCRFKKRTLLYAIAADLDCLPDLYYMPKKYERMLYTYGIKHASAVISQTDQQKSDLKENFNVESVTICNCTRTPSKEYANKKRYVVNGKITVAWIGRFIEIKRMEWLYECAERAKEIDFLVAGWGEDGDRYFKEMLNRGKELGNVSLLGRLSPEEIDSVYKKTDILLCTSIREGLPNVFMEAWARGIPIVSTVDPQNAINTNGLGLIGHDVTELLENIRKITTSEILWRKISTACYEYFNKWHTIESCARQYSTVIENIFKKD